MKKQKSFYFGIISSLILSACANHIVCDISVEACGVEIKDSKKNNLLYSDSLKVFHFNEKGEKEVVLFRTDQSILTIPESMTGLAANKKNVFLQWSKKDIDTLRFKSSSKEEVCKPITIDSVWYNGVLCARFSNAHFLAIKK